MRAADLGDLPAADAISSLVNSSRWTTLPSRRPPRARRTNPAPAASGVLDPHTSGGRSSESRMASPLFCSLG